MDARSSSTPGRNRAQLRPDCKLALLVSLLSRDGGWTLSELTTALQWLPHTTRAALTRLRQRGFAVERYKSEAERVRSSESFPTTPAARGRFHE